MDSIVMTGAAGRIGTLLRQHWSRSYRIVGIDVRPAASCGANEEFIVGLIQGPRLGHAFHIAGKRPFVVHLAAVTSDDAPWDEYLATNIDGTARVFHEALRTRARMVIFASTNHVTGLLEKELAAQYQGEVPAAKRISPKDPARPDGLYAASKACGELLGRYYHDCHGLSVICLRIGSVTDADDPRDNPRLRATWLSHRDCCGLFECCLSARVGFGVYYACSNNTRRFWDLTNAKKELGFSPRDNADVGPIMRMDGSHGITR